VGSIEEQSIETTHGLFKCLSEASCLSPLGRVEKKSEPLARWEAKPSRSKSERINLKWSLLQFGIEGEQKIQGWAQVGGEWEYTVASQKYTPVLRARGV
jgi:hypothetical protein